MNDEQRFHPYAEEFDGHDIDIPGLTLRQWYAGQVIQGICASNSYPCMIAWWPTPKRSWTNL